MESNYNSLLQIQEGAIYAFYIREDEPSRFLAGRVAQWEQSGEALVRLIAPDGTPDGLLLFNIACAYRVEYDSRYLQQLEKIAVGDILTISGETAWDTLLRYAKDHKIAVQLRDQNFRRLTSGFVVHFTNQNVAVQRIKNNGRIGQSRSFRRENIRFLFCGSDSEIALMRQYQEVQNEN